MEALLELLIPLVSSTAANAITNKITNPTTQSSSSSELVVHPAPVNHVEPLSLPLAPSPHLPRPQTANPSVTIPFQFQWYGLTGQEKGHTSITITEISIVKEITKFYRDVTLSHLEAVIFAGSRSYSEPVTIELCWTPATNAISSNILDHPGAIRFCVGGLNLTNSGVLPCDLNYINPIVKSPISYDNAPRLNVHFNQNEGSKINTGTSGSLIIRGSLNCSVPSIY